MRTTFTVILTLVFAVIASAQVGPVVPKAASLEWDDTNPPGVVQTSRMYCASTTPVEQDPLNMVGEIDAPALTWAITLDPGQWYCAVSFHDGEVESELSNEVAFFVFNPPGSLRIVQ